LSQDDLPVHPRNTPYVLDENSGETVGAHFPRKENDKNKRDSWIVHNGPVEIREIDKKTEKVVKKTVMNMDYTVNERNGKTRTNFIDPSPAPAGYKHVYALKPNSVSITPNVPKFAEYKLLHRIGPVPLIIHKKVGEESTKTVHNGNFAFTLNKDGKMDHLESTATEKPAAGPSRSSG
jgi:hypothetical protein